MKKQSENRKLARLFLRSKVNFVIVETPDADLLDERFHGEGVNIGVEGLLFVSDKELPKGTMIDIELYLPKRDEPVYLQGEVRWCTVSSTGLPSVPIRPRRKKLFFDIGIKFLEIPNNHVLTMIKYLCGHLDENSNVIL